MRKQRVLARIAAGPAWKSGPPEAQGGWDEHADFVDRLVDEGTFVMGGPRSDHRGSYVVLENVDAAEARRILEDDPFVENGVFIVEDVADWTVYVDELSRPAG